jgi:hypothetical protein
VSAEQTGGVVPGAGPQQSPRIDPDTITRIEARARRLVRERLRAALDEQTAAGAAAQPPSDADGELLDRIADEESKRAGAALLHVAVVHAVSQELGIEINDALAHPAVDRARELLRQGDGTRTTGAIATGGAPRRSTPTPDAEGREAPTAGGVGARAPAPRQRALLLDAVHVFGIETLEPGDSDIELRFADAGIDVRKPSTAQTIGRLRWDEVRTMAVQRPRRGLPGRRRPGLFVAATERGEVTFELPDVSEDEIVEHLEPLIARNRARPPDPEAD